MLFSINKHRNKGEVLFSDPDSPLCLRFWTHMYGNGIGTLSILLKDTRESKEWEIWSLSGEAGNAWYQAELPISSPNQFMVRTEIWYAVSFKDLDMMACQTNPPLQLVSLIYCTSLIRDIYIYIYEIGLTHLLYSSVCLLLSKNLLE